MPMFAGLEIFDLLGLLISAVLTLLVLLYAFGDNVFFRLALYMFVGVSAGYAGAVAIHDVLVPQFNSLEFSQMVVPLLVIGMLVVKLSPRTAVLGNPASAFLVGVGAAIAVGGAIQGTLIPQVEAAGAFFSPAEMQHASFGQTLNLLFQGVLILVGTVTSLVSFHFTARWRPNEIPQRNRIIEWVARVGRIFVSITFGVIFAGIYSAALTALVERFNFLYQVIMQLMSFGA
jgi:hypothetical protein